MTTAPATADRAASDARLAEAYNDLEPVLCDIRNMMLVLETVLEDTLPYKGHSDELFGGRPVASDYKRFLLTNDQLDALSYAEHHLGDLIRTLQESYYKAFERPKSGAEPTGR
jgi:hypothetical protein